MDKKSKIVLVIGILLSVAGLVSLVRAGVFHPEPLLPCSVTFTTDGPSEIVNLPFGCTPTGLETAIQVSQEALNALVGAEARR